MLIRCEHMVNSLITCSCPVSFAQELAMLSKLSTHIKDPSVLRRAEFAATFYPRSMPFFWNHLASFSLMKREHRNSFTTEEARQFIENVEVLNKDALATDMQLLDDIVGMVRTGTDTPLGVVLISSKDSCRNCGSKLYIRADRPSTITVYNDSMGTLPGTHYTKYCRSGRCSLQQYYGFYTMGSLNETRYDEDWATLPYFMSTRETAFTMDMLHRLDKEILIGQISYKQRADIYNDIHGYVMNKSVDENRFVPVTKATQYVC